MDLLSCLAASAVIAALAGADDLEAFRYLHENRESGTVRTIAFVRVMKTGSSSLLNSIQQKGTVYATEHRPYLYGGNEAKLEEEAALPDRNFDLWISGHQIKFREPVQSGIARAMELAAPGGTAAPLAYTTIFRRPQDWLRSRYEHGRPQLGNVTQTEQWLSSRSSGLQNLNDWMAMFPESLSAPFRAFLRTAPLPTCMGDREFTGCMLAPAPPSAEVAKLLRDADFDAMERHLRKQRSDMRRD